MKVRRLRGFSMLVLSLAMSACRPPLDPGYQGYAEGEFVLVASPFAGQLTALHVRRGGQVQAGAALFDLEQDAERAAQREAKERVHQAQAQSQNLTTPRRPPEREAALAAVQDARSALLLSTRELQRQEDLFAKGFVSEATIDSYRNRNERNRALLDQAQAQLVLFQQSLGRREEVSAAKAEVGAARAALSQKDWALEQRSQQAPVSGLVFDTFFVPGEWVPAGRPVVSLLPPGNLKLRFYVPQPDIGAIRVGQPVQVSCDGCLAPIAAAITYVSVSPEYTPPVIYSREQRAKLVFLVEARPEPGQTVPLKPGQPVDVKVTR